MLHHKCTNNINELSSYFQKSTTPAMTAILNVIQGLCFSDRQVDLQTSWKKRRKLLQPKRRCCYSFDVAKLMFFS